MKILAIICEFNPFHNGHRYLLERARALSGCDKVLCIMSGNFTQRGEICVLDKFSRARHAVLGGADCVIQLPAPFAVAPAEVFAKGAVKILSAIPSVSAIAFGCESGDRQSFINGAKLLIDESEAFKNILSEKLDSGESYIKSYAAAFEKIGGASELLSNPNNILGLEYTKAILRENSKIDIFTVRRIGGGYNDNELKENYSSASAIRANFKSDGIKNNVPDFVYADLQTENREEFESMLRHCLFKAQAIELKNIYGCGEGLENKLKSLENEPLETIVEKATCKRYSSSRIKRILTANMLGLYGSDCGVFLKSDLYIKPLAVKKQCADEVLSALAKSDYPVITGTNGENLTGAARNCFEKDKYEHSVYCHLTHSHRKDYMILV